MLQVDGLKGEITTFDNPKVPLKPQELPGFLIDNHTRATHQRLSRSELQTTRDFFVLVIVEEFADGNVKAKQDAYDACEPFVDNIPLIFARNPALLDADGKELPGVAGYDFRDEGAGETVRETKRFSAIPLIVTVVYVRNVAPA